MTSCNDTAVRWGSALALVAAVLACPAGSFAAAPDSVPAAIFSDPSPDSVHPARMEVLHIPSHGVEINGLAYLPSGAGPHPTLVLFHGLPGNEKNLDLAQAVRRAGWIAITVNYRGSWGSPGTFRFTHVLEDARAVLAWVREPATALALGVDPHRLVVAGHSMGGWAVALTAAHDPALSGAILISMGDLGRLATQPRDRLVAIMADNKEALADATAQGMADEVRRHAGDFQAERAAAGLVGIPLLALTADDGLAPDTTALVRSIEAHGGHQVTELHEATDHSWSNRRVALASLVIRWLEALH